MLNILNRQNFRKLRDALRQEPLPQILKNTVKYIARGGRPEMTSAFYYDSKELGCQFNLDFALFSEYSSSLVVKGWFIKSNENDEYAISIDGHEVTPSYYRPDVSDSIGLGSKQWNLDAGFYLIKSWEIKDNDQLTFKLVHQGQEVFSRKVKVSSIQSIEHLPMSRNQQYLLYQDIDEKTRRSSAEITNEGPKISVVVPVYNVSIEYLQPCIESVINQTYSNWELILCDDASTRIDTLSYLKSLEGLDPRIQVIYNTVNQNISATTNNAIKQATGEYICLLDHDDLLYKDALLEVVLEIGRNPDAEIIYSDEDKLDFRGKRIEPYYKPKFSKQLLLANNYICHILVVKRALGDSIQWFRVGFEGAQDHDLILRLIEKTEKIYHIPKVLYHWRKIEGSTALSHGEKSYAQKAGLKAVKEHLKRIGVEAKVKNGNWAGSYKINYKTKTQPKVSIIIPFKDQVKFLKKCIRSIYDKTSYSNYEIVLVDNQSQLDETKEFLHQYELVSNVRILQYDRPFNYSAINNWAISQCDGEMILLLNNDIEVLSKQWLTKMVSNLIQKNVGAVGAHLMYDDNTNQHNGIVLGIGGVAGHAFKALDSNQYHYYLDGATRNVSGCTAACLLVARDTYETVGGLDEENLKVAFNDVDFCLKIRQINLSIVFLHDVKLYHFESKSRGYEDTPEKVARFKKEEAYMKENWGDILMNDPFYNPNLTLIRQDYGMNMEGVIKKYLQEKAEN